MINSNFVSIVLAGTNDNRLPNTLNLKSSGSSIPSGGSSWMIFLVTSLAKATTAGLKDSGIYLIFGNGNTPPNDDYSLSSEITSGLTCNAIRQAYTKSGMIYTSTITNDSSNPITITEIGLCEDCVQSAAYYAQAILGREEIEPITLQPGDTKSFTYKINLSVEE